MHNKLTATEIRRMLFNNQNMYAVIGTEEMTNSEARRYLFDIDSNTEFHVKDNGSHLLIY